MRLLCFLLTFILCANLYAQDENLKTLFEESEGKETPTYSQTIAFAKQLAEKYPRIKYESFGVSSEGRELPLLIFDSDENFDVESVKDNGNTILFVQACIHAGEPCGKDAGFIFLRDLATNKFLSLGRKVTILFIPILNVDGHERFSAFNRINQNGPEKMGWRTNSQNLNLNRDYMKSDSKEIQEWHKLFNKWLPDFFVDCHSSDGADYQYVMTYEMCVNGNMDKGLTDWQLTQFIPFFEKNMKKSKNPIFQYVVFRNWHDPRSGLKVEIPKPCTSHGYVALNNRPSLLLETHMLKPYKERVRAVYEALKYTVRFLDKSTNKLKSLIEEADKFSASEEFAKRYYTLDYEVDMSDSIMVDFKGVEYTVEKSDLTGGLWFKYNNEKPQNYNIPMFKFQKPVHRIDLPAAYIVPQSYKDVVDRLKYHGIECFRIDGKYNFTAELTKFKNVSFLPMVREGRTIIKFDYDRDHSEIVVEDGDYVVPVNQRNSRVIAHLLEPYGPDSFVNWGFFNSVFEQKEYGESYVMEKMARDMLANDPKLKEEYEKKKNEDPEFAKNSWTQLNWFYMKSKYRDKNYNLYPVKRIMNKVIINYLPRKE
jgi:hypothetical protein